MEDKRVEHLRKGSNSNTSALIYVDRSLWSTFRNHCKRNEVSASSVVSMLIDDFLSDFNYAAENLDNRRTESE